MEKELSKVNTLNEVTRISEGTVINGDLSSENDIRVDGKIVGKVFSKGKVVLGEKSSINGALICECSDVWGSIKGDIFIKDTISLKSNSSVEGSLNVNKIQVEVGAKINGSCKMIDEQEFGKYSEAVVKNAIVAAPESAPVSKKK